MKFLKYFYTYKETKWLELASRLLLLIFWGVILFKAFRPDPPIITCFSNDISLLIWGFPAILSLIIIFYSFYAQKKRDLSVKKAGKKFLKFLILFLIICLVTSFFTCSLCSTRGKAFDAKRQSDIRQISLAQEIFYEQNGRYAIAQEELVESRILGSIMRDPQTRKEYTDKDGSGIEGGDYNPNTWSAEAALIGYGYEICYKIQPKLFFVCDNNDCKKENRGEEITDEETTEKGEVISETVKDEEGVKDEPAGGGGGGGGQGTVRDEEVNDDDKKEFSYPYPLSWEETETDGRYRRELSLTAISLGERNIPSFVRSASYVVGKRVYALTLYFKIRTYWMSAAPCLSTDFRIVLSEEGDLLAPMNSQFPGGCLMANRTYLNQEVVFEVSENQKEFYLTTGGDTNIFFSVKLLEDGDILVEKFYTGTEG